MGLLQQLRDRWINFVTPNKGERKVHVTQCELFTIQVPAVAVSDKEKYNFISEVVSIMEEEIKIVKPKSKSKTKSK